MMLGTLVEIKGDVSGSDKDGCLSEEDDNAAYCSERVPITIFPNGLGDFCATSVSAQKVMLRFHVAVESVTA